MPEINNIEIHSEEVQDIMGYIPHWIIRKGLAVIFFVLLLIITGSYFFKYPEIVTAPIVLVTQNPPISLVCKSSGKIEQWFLQDGQQVKAGTAVALIENTADYTDVQSLKKQLEGLHNKQWESTVAEKECPNDLELGTLQEYWVRFQRNWNSFHSYLKLNYIPKKIELTRIQINKQKAYLKTLSTQRVLQQNELGLAKKSFLRDSLLYLKGVYAELDFDESMNGYIQKKKNYIAYEASMQNTESNILALEKSMVELDLQYKTEINQYNLNMDESLQVLKAAIDSWEEQFLLASPIDGQLTLTNLWAENQVVVVGERLASVVPSDNTVIIGKALIPSSGLGKVEVGQKVNIKLSGFPYVQFGMLKGKIKAISLVPEKKAYLAEIELLEGMKSSYSEDLKFIQEMDGTADIITKDYRLIYRFLHPLKALRDKNRGYD